MSDAINTTSLISLDEAKAYLNLNGDEHNIVLGYIVKGISARLQSAMNRRLRSATYTHDGTTLPRLRSYGGSVMWLPNTPVTSITTLKLDADASALTRGWDQDYTLDSATGKITLRNGYTFWDRDETLEITYAGGYLNDSALGSASEAFIWGYDDRSADIRLACMQQVKAEYQRWQNEDEGVVQRSEETVSVTMPQSEFIPSVQAVVNRYRFDPMPVASLSPMDGEGW